MRAAVETRFFLTQVLNPDHLERSVYQHIVWSPRREPASVDVVLDVWEHEKAFVKCVSIHYASNRNAEQHVFELGGLGSGGAVSCTLAAHAQGKPEARDAALYLPEVTKKMPLIPICRYLGLEDAIAGRKSSAVMTGGSDSSSHKRFLEVYSEDDPLVVFLQEQRHHFKKIEDTDVVLMGDAHKTISGRRCYAIKKSAAEMVSGFVSKHIVPALAYLGSDNCITIASQQVPTEHEVVLVVLIEYVLVTPRAGSLKSITYKMNPQQMSLYQVGRAVARHAFAHLLEVARLHARLLLLRGDHQRLGLGRGVAVWGNRRCRCCCCCCHWSGRDEAQDVILRHPHALLHLGGARVVESAHEVPVLIDGAETQGEQIVHGHPQLDQRRSVPVLVAQALQRPALGRKAETKAVAKVRIAQLCVLAHLGPW